MDPLWLLGIYVFVLATLTGRELIHRVPPTLHTPLMSGANAISGITLIGSLLVAGQSESRDLAAILAGVAVVMATVNVVGGFMVTGRMLRMFRKD
jgi:H+-translocating NAD(P) transhydrogenase subunit alpha